MTDPLQLSALEQAAAIRQGALSSEELTRFYLGRIERFNPELQAFVSVQARRALRRARALDGQLRERRNSKPIRAFHGVPLGIKDLVLVRGTPTRLGSRAYRYFIAPIDVPAAKRMKRAGFVVLGKLATSEFGALPITEPDIHPPSRNPWNTEHTPGGSSGGSGAAVAAGLIPIAHGSDGGGSIRIPSAFCHLFGLKPSRMLLGNLHGPVNELGLSVMGPLAQSVEDAAAMLDVLAGNPDAFVAESSLLARCRRAPRPMRILMCLDAPFGKVDPAIVAAVEATARQLEALGHHVEPVAPVRGELQEFLPLWQVQLAAVPSISERLLQPVTRWLRAAGRQLDVEQVKQQQQMLSKRVLDFFGDADMLLTPTVPILAPRVGAYGHLEPAELFEAISEIAAFTALFNVTGQPAASIPTGVSQEGSLPHGVQLVGRIDADGDLLSVCHQLEQAMPFRSRKPQGFGLPDPV